MKIFTIMWSSYLPLLKEAADSLKIDLLSYSSKQLGSDPSRLPEAARRLQEADLILLYRTGDAFWNELEDDITAAGKRIPVVAVGSDPSLWAASTVHPEIVAATYQYFLYNGRENIANMFLFLLHAIFHEPVAYAVPEAVPWQGICRPASDAIFSSAESYFAESSIRPAEAAATVGLLYSRSNWVTGNLEIEKSIVAALESRNVAVIPVFFYSLKDGNLGNLSGVEVIDKYLTDGGRPLVDGIVKLTSFFLGTSRGGLKETEAISGAALAAKLNVPIFNPVISYYKNRAEWQEDPQGLGTQVSWSLAMPEFEGVVEPMVIGATRGIAVPEEEAYEPIAERIERLADRIARWLVLRRKPSGEKKVAFILHNNPCASVEATVGAGAHLDTLESVADIMKRMKAGGWNVDPPADGKALIDTIMNRKAVSEFRWTTVEEIVTKGGALDLVGLDRYMPWFEELPEATKERMNSAWGNPPGEEKDGIPAAMVHEGRIAVTGVRFGNAVVCVQPKRGCAGAKCDGQVCKILHDPDVPPPHQYVATYKWLSREFGADVLVHVGTHGNLEFLPGKATGLSSGCFPDIGIDTLPHLYIYNADNPPEGTTAKRRSNAVLVDHMQTVMAKGELYGDLEQVERLLAEYEKYRDLEPARAHTISHMIVDKVSGLNLLDGDGGDLHERFDEKVRDLHDRLALLKNTFIPKGMHVFGRLPAGEKLAAFVYAVIRYEKTPESLRGAVDAIVGRTTEKNGEEREAEADASAGAACRAFVLDGVPLAKTLGEEHPLRTEDLAVLDKIEASIGDLLRNIAASDEIAALMGGMDGGYIPPGPSGLITRGRADVLPTGRNFYSLDPQRIPTPAAWEIGGMLADRTVGKYLDDAGRYPENIAFHWQCTDIMWADGEGMAQMFRLLGVRPVWQANGRVKGFEILPLSEMGRPRIDITVRVSGITRDNFPASIDLLDDAVRTVAVLDEPPELNFVRKHTLENLGGNAAASKEDLRAATYRIFASMPGTYQAGTQLAVYASAWKTAEDLSDIFLYWNGYAYGRGAYGAPAHPALKASLKTVDVTFNKTVTDEYDLTGCCCYFGTHGGMINAARVVSGRDIRNYYGDTREPDKVSVRTLTEEVRRIARAKILNPAWIEGMKEHGYKGASEISKRVGRLYGWQATAKAVDGAVFDDVARTFMMDRENRDFFEENNPWALEEMARRLIEAAERGLWQPAPDVREALKDLYVEIEGWIEEKMGDMKGDYQGGAIDVFTTEDVAAWKNRMKEILG